MKKTLLKPIAVTSLLLAGLVGAEEQRLFSVSLFGYGRQNSGDPWTQEDVRQSVQMDGIKEAGIWQTAAWDSFGPTGFPGTRTIMADDGATTATFQVTSLRSHSAYGFVTARNSDTWDDGNASMLEGHLIGTHSTAETPTDRRVKFQISDIPFALYDMVIYLSHNQGQWQFGAPGGTANLRYNEQIDSDPDGLTGGIQFRVSHDPVGTTNVEPNGGLRQIVNPGDTGNYIVLTGLTESTFRGEVWGQERNHVGISGFQILESDVVMGDPDPDVSTVVASPLFLPADDETESTITVTLRDENGIRVPDWEVTLETDDAATISPSGPVTSDAQGEAVFTVKSDTPGTADFTAKAAQGATEITLNETASLTFVDDADADASTLAVSPIFVTADGNETSTITVTVLAIGNFPLEGKEVTLAQTAGPGSAVILPASATSNASGVATFTVSSTTPGAAEFTATVTTDSVEISQKATVNFVGLADAGESTVAASPSSVVADGVVASTITVSVKDANTFPAAGRTVSLEALAGPGTPDIVPASALTDANGVAIFSVTSDTPGTEVFAATVDAVTITDTASVEFVDATTPRAFNVNFWTFTPAGSYSPEVESVLIGPANGLGERWNQFNANSGASLLDSTGVATGVAFTTNFSEGRAANAGNTPMLRSTLTDFGRGASRTLTITGLQPDGLYDVWLASYRDGVTIERTYGRWTANNPTSSSNIQFIDNRDGVNGTTFVEGYNYIVFLSVVPDGSGVISFDGKGMMLADGADGDYRLGLSGFQIAPAAGPPPPTDTLVINLGNDPGTVIEGGTFIGSGPTNLPIPELPEGSILRSIAMDVSLVATTNDNFASDLAVLLGPSGGDFSVEITNGNAPFGDINTVSLGWTGGGAGPVTPLKETKTAADWADAGAIDLGTNGLFLGNAYVDSGFQPGDGGTWSGTITLTYDVVSPSTLFEEWSGGEPFDGDKNGDGVSNGLAFLLGATNPDASALGLLPAASEDAGGLVLTFSMLNAASRGPATLDVQWSSDLGQADPWAGNVATVPETTGAVNGVNFVITPNGSLNDVVATIPSSEASAGKLFGRLEGSEN